LVLPTGEFRLLDMRLAQDPDTHGLPGAGLASSIGSRFFGSSMFGGGPWRSAQGGPPPLYPRFVAQPATDPWNWLQCGMGFGATFEGVPCLNIPEGTEDEMFSEDVQLGVKQTQRQQWNPLWLADQEEPPTYDPTYARNLNVRMVQIIQRQEQLTGTALAAAVTPATQDDESNTLGFLYPWDLCRETSDDNSLKGAIHVLSLDVTGCPFAPITFNAVWITHGRAQGMAYQEGGGFVRGDGTSSDDATAGTVAFFRKASGASAWETIGSFEPDATGRWRTPPAKELGYTYGVKHRSMASHYDVGEFRTREYQYGQVTEELLGACSIARDAMGCPIWAACERDGDVNAYALDGPTDADLWHCPGNPALTGAAYKYASICACDDGSIIVGATNTDQGRIDVVRSRNNGTTWEAVNTAFGTGLVNGHLFHIHGQVYLVGWADDKVWLVTSSQPDLTREVMDGTNSIIKVCAHAVGAGEDAPQCSVIVDDTGQIMVAVAGDADTRFYSCRNFRTGFSLVA